MAGSLFNELEESQFGIYAAGTFRIEGEEDEGKQPMFNLAKINCEKQFDDRGRVSFECKVAEAIVSAFADKPDTNNPNCSLDLDAFTYSMKELEKGVLAGMDESGTCYNTVLTIDKNAKRVYRSFTRTKYGKPDFCGTLPRTQTLMNCTSAARIRIIRKQGRAPLRYCDFSSSSDK